MAEGGQLFIMDKNSQENIWLLKGRRVLASPRLSFAVFARTTLAGCLEWFFGDVWPVKGCFVVADS